MLVHCRVTPIIKFAGTHLHSWGLSVLSENTTQSSRPGLEPGPLDMETFIGDGRLLGMGRYFLSEHVQPRENEVVQLNA